MDKCREEFEQWFKTTQYFCNYFTDSDLNLNHRNEYENEIINGAWLTWQHQQAKVEELKASHHGEVIGHEVHFKKIKQERDELQKRVDAVDKVIGKIRNGNYASDQAEGISKFIAGMLEQALKGEG